MCGIAGILDTAAPIQPNSLEAMTQALKHRGPDAQATWTSTQQPFVGLGHTRLSIIDLEGGAQPMSSSTGCTTVVFNGEIYNFPELKAELEAKGYVFQTHSDTEVICAAYEAYGVDCVKHFRGMFAFALWDKKHQRLLLARDRVGKKPLLYAQTPNGFIFASEFQAILKHPDIDKTPNWAAVHQYLTLGYVVAPQSAYQGIQKLLPAHRLIWEKGETTIEPYWQLNFSEKQSLSITEAAEVLDHQLAESVRLRLRSDVPVGVFLSGGLDSNTVAHYAAQQSANLSTFSIGFASDNYNELPIAKQMAQHFGTKHHEQVVEPDAVSLFPKLVQHYGEPFADSSALPSYYLAQMTAEHVKVALNGDGGDEVFAGYYRHLAYAKADQFQRLPSMLRQGIQSALTFGRQESGPGHRTFQRFFDAAELQGVDRWMRWICFFTDQEKAQLLHPRLQRITTSMHDGLGQLEGVDAALAIDTQINLPNDLLVKMDIATMAHGLEARSPLLDHKLMEWMASLPANYKVHGKTLKHLLRVLQRKHLPSFLLNREKQGFAVPIADWFRTSLAEYVRNQLSEDSELVKQEVVAGSVMTEWIAEHQDGRKDRGHQIWALLMLEFWLRQ